MTKKRLAILSAGTLMAATAHGQTIVGSIDTIRSSAPVKFEKLCANRDVIAEEGLPVCVGDVAVMPDGRARVVIIRSDKSPQTLTLENPVVQAASPNRLMIFLGRINQTVWDLFSDRREQGSATSKGSGDDPSILGVRAENGLILRQSGTALVLPWTTTYPAHLVVARVMPDGSVSPLAAGEGKEGQTPIVTVPAALIEPGQLRITIVEDVAAGVNKASVFSALVVPRSTRPDFLAERTPAAPSDSATLAEAGMFAADSEQCKRDAKMRGCGAWRLEAFQVADRLASSADAEVAEDAARMRSLMRQW
ncbi:MAG: hypothetical protein P0Y59_23355 [Candidatus Sphingomonas phytovorans]|nr:hypothetical protein [Sphingomonas sp.]WEJ99799.1 MAG: hypothetical protein P0Y59_23355 [Sphingomonas sp.]